MYCSWRTSSDKTWQTCVRGPSSLSGLNELNPYLSYLVPNDRVRIQIICVNRRANVHEIRYLVGSDIFCHKILNLMTGVANPHRECGKLKKYAFRFFFQTVLKLCLSFLRTTRNEYKQQLVYHNTRSFTILKFHGKCVFFSTM